MSWGKSTSLSFRFIISYHSRTNMLINLVERKRLCAAAETLLAAMWIERHQSSFSCVAQNYHFTTIHYHYHNFGAFYVCQCFFGRIIYIICDWLKWVILLTVSIKSSVINVCHLLNLCSWESIMPDVLSADISLPVVLRIAFPCWLSMSRRNLASLY